MVGSAPRAAVSHLMAAFADWEAISNVLAAADLNLRPDELLRVIDPLSGRLRQTPLTEGEAAISEVALSPHYIADVEPVIGLAWREHLGLLAVERQLTQRMIATLSRSSSWADEADHIEINAALEVVLNAHGDVDERLAEGEELHEFASRHSDIDALLEHLGEQPAFLIRFPKFGVRTTWRSKLGGTTPLPDFEISTNFVQSVVAMNYMNEPRRAAACLRAMALIVADRRDAVAGHPERRGAGANNPVVRDGRGYAVQRTYLAQHSPNAHRMFWIDAPTPHFLNVGGHEASPTLKA